MGLVSSAVKLVSAASSMLSFTPSKEVFMAGIFAWQRNACVCVCGKLNARLWRRLLLFRHRVQ